jgi:hypothetical protein
MMIPFQLGGSLELAYIPDLQLLGCLEQNSSLRI